MAVDILLVGSNPTFDQSILSMISNGEEKNDDSVFLTLRRRKTAKIRLLSLSLQDETNKDFLTPLAQAIKESRPRLILIPILPDALSTSLYRAVCITQLGIPSLLILPKEISSEEEIKQLVCLTGCPVYPMEEGRSVFCEMLTDLTRFRHFSFLFHDKGLLLESMHRIRSILYLYETKQEDVNQLSYEILQKNSQVLSSLNLPLSARDKITEIIQHFHKSLENCGEDLFVLGRVSWINHFTKKNEEKKFWAGLSANIDKVLLHKWTGPLALLFLILLIYSIAVGTIGLTLCSGLTWLFDEGIIGNLRSLLEGASLDGAFSHFLLDGLLTGLFSLLCLTPQVVLTFMILNLLGKMGILDRAAYQLSILFTRYQLPTRILIPLMSGKTNSVPPVKSASSIYEERLIRMAAMLQCFVMDRRKVFLFVILCAAFFPHWPWIAVLTYLIMLSALMLFGIIFRRIPYFDLEILPEKLTLKPLGFIPIKTYLKEVLQFLRQFILFGGLAGGFSGVLLYVMMHRSFSLKSVSLPDSMYATVGRILSILYNPIGLTDFKGAGALTPALYAKGSVITSYDLLYTLEGSNSSAGNFHPEIFGDFTVIGAFSLLLFLLISCVNIGDIKRLYGILGSARWVIRTFLFQTLSAYLISFCVYQIATALFYNTGHLYWVVFATCFIALFIGILVISFSTRFDKSVILQRIGEPDTSNAPAEKNPSESSPGSQKTKAE